MSTAKPPSPPQQQPPPPSSSSSFTRPHPALTIYLTGTALLTLSALLTRRSLLRRHRSLTPHFFHPSNAQPLITINGRLEAYQALGVATMNVASVFVMVGGGLLWAFDVGSLEELRGRVGKRRRWGTGNEEGREGGGKEEVEFERWVASFTGRQVGDRKEEERRWSARAPEMVEQAGDETQAAKEKGKPR